MKICIDPGHGGKFNNATGNGLTEKDVVLKYASYLRNQLEHFGHEVIMTREGDRELADDLDQDLLVRTQIANNWGADCFISLHCNGFPDPAAHGFEVWTSPGETSSDHLAEEILVASAAAFPEIKQRLDRSDGDGDKEAKFVVLTKTKMAAVLIEIGFLTNINDANRIKSQVNMVAMTEAWAGAVMEWRQEWLV